MVAHQSRLDWLLKAMKFAPTQTAIIVMTPTVKTSKPSAAAIDMPMGVKSVTIGSMPAKMMWMNSTSSSQTIREPV